MNAKKKRLGQEPRPFYAEQHAVGDRVVLRIGGECDAATLERLSAALDAAIEQQPQEVVVDLADATFLDSLTLGSLTAAAKRVRADGGSFRVIRAVATEVRRAFELTHLDTYLLAPPSAQRGTTFAPRRADDR